MSHQLQKCPKQLYLIKRKQAVFGHGRDVFGFIRKKDVERVTDILSKKEVDIFHCRDIVPYRHDLILKSDYEEYCYYELFKRDDYVQKILDNRLSIRVVIETNDQLGDGALSLISSLKIDPIFDDKDSYLKYLAKVFEDKN